MKHTKTANLTKTRVSAQPRLQRELKAGAAAGQAVSAGLRGATRGVESADKPLPADWVYREDTVPGWAVTFKVPRYIVRLDSYATHGWQVRYPKAPSKMFSDGMYGTSRRRGTPHDSLKAAKRHLATIWTGKPPAKLRPEQTGKDQPTGLAGVRIVWRKGADRNVAHCVVRVDGPIVRPLAVVYVGTELTITDERLNRALHKARMFRLAHLDDLGRLNLLPASAKPLVQEYLARRRYWTVALTRHLSGEK